MSLNTEPTVRPQFSSLWEAMWFCVENNARVTLSEDEIWNCMSRISTSISPEIERIQTEHRSLYNRAMEMYVD